jgi:hypothetical protein
MTIVHCPRCRDEVTVPPRATPRALVRCPLCLEQYLLSEALVNAPPPLVIIGGEVETSAITQSDEPEYRVSVPPAHEFIRPAATPLVIPRSVIQTRSRPRRPEKSGLILLVNYVVGGVMGLAMGLLVLWWGFRKDPLELGPRFAQYVPWIVPTQFHGTAVGPATPNQSVNAASEKGKITVQRRPVAQANDTQNDLHALLDLPEPTKLPDETAAPTNEPENKGLVGGGGHPDLRDLLPDGPPEAVKPSP